MTMEHNQMPRSNDGFNSASLFADSHQFNTYDPIFQTASDQSFDAGWGVNASNFPPQSRAPHAAPQSWLQQGNANQLSVSSNDLNGQRSLSHSPTPYGQNAFAGYGTQPDFPYRQQPQYDPALMSSSDFGPDFNYPAANYESRNSGTIAPQALEQNLRATPITRVGFDKSNLVPPNASQPQPAPSNTKPADQTSLANAIPSGHDAGYFSIINFDDLATSTNSERMGAFLNLGREAMDWNINRAALPAYVPRKSRADLRRLAADDPKLLARLGKKVIKKAINAPRLQLPTPSASTESIKYHDTSSDGESSSDDDDESSYTSESDTEPSPLPDRRASSPREAVEYDTIKALWRGKRKPVSSESIRKGVVDFWEVVKTIRDRWKADSNAVKEATEKNRKTELPLLESRVKDQRDMMEAAFKAALKHGHRSIIELLAENASLIYLCYQFLLDRVKAEDYNSALSRTILEIMSMFTTLNQETLDRTHLVKVLPRFAKRGDAKTQYYAKRITANVAAASKGKPSEDSKEPSAVAVKETAATSSPAKRANPEQLAGLKRAASSTGDSSVSKKVATTATKANTASTHATVNGVAKKIPAAADNTKLAMNTSGTANKTKQAISKPSGFFSSLQSAGKKPGTSIASRAAQAGGNGNNAKPVDKTKASTTAGNVSTAPKSHFSFKDTMAALAKPKEEKPTPKAESAVPVESPEEKAKRVKKEARRQLHVSFKTGDDLVEVRYFTHDPEEEIAHDSSQMRDVADVGGEGRMFKQASMHMDIDDEEDEVAEEGQRLIEFASPTLIDFSVVDDEERKKNYFPYGGGEIQPDSAERAIRERYEADTLIEVYTDAKDIPPNPREPSDTHMDDHPQEVTKFGSPDEKWQKIAIEMKAARQQRSKQPQQLSAAPPIDLSKLAKYINNPQFQPSSIPLPQNQSQPPVDNLALNNILETLKSGLNTQPQLPQPPQQQQQQPAASTAFSSEFKPAANMNSLQTSTQPPAPAPAQFDLAGILANLKGAQQQQQQQVPATTVTTQAPPLGSLANIMSSFQPQMQQGSMFASDQDNNNINISGDINNQKHPLWRTRVCKYWQEGKCQKGDSCSFKHED